MEWHDLHTQCSAYCREGEHAQVFYVGPMIDQAGWDRFAAAVGIVILQMRRIEEVHPQAHTWEGNVFRQNGTWYWDTPGIDDQSWLVQVICPGQSVREPGRSCAPSKLQQVWHRLHGGAVVAGITNVARGVSSLVRR